MISIGQKLPDAKFNVLTEKGMTELTTGDIFNGKKVVMLALPGAFTPTCSATHLPGFIVNFDKFVAKGVDKVVCLSVNDAFVMKAWKEASNAENILMLADGEALFTNALGLSVNRPGMGVRSHRYSMLVVDGEVQQFNLDDSGKFEVSDAETLLNQI